jgi:hypothetical protein
VESSLRSDRSQWVVGSNPAEVVHRVVVAFYINEKFKGIGKLSSIYITVLTSIHKIKTSKLIHMYTVGVLGPRSSILDSFLMTITAYRWDIQSILGIFRRRTHLFSQFNTMTMHIRYIMTEKL